MHKMKQKKQFTRPAILQELSLLPDTPILQGSVSDNVTVATTGQEVQDYDFSGEDPIFNHDWE
jgi:hypothetical protein